MAQLPFSCVSSARWPRQKDVFQGTAPSALAVSHPHGYADGVQNSELIASFKAANGSFIDVVGDLPVDDVKVLDRSQRHVSHELRFDRVAAPDVGCRDEESRINEPLDGYIGRLIVDLSGGRQINGPCRNGMGA